MSLPYFPMYPSDFEAKTSHLTIVEDGAYNRLLRICWMTPGCSIPEDEAWIMRRVRATTEEEREAVRAVLAEFFTVKNKRYFNSRLSRIWVEVHDAHEKRKNAGSKGGAARSLKSNNSRSSNAKAMPKQPEPEPEPDEDTNVSSLAPSAQNETGGGDSGASQKKPRRKPQRSLPDDWVPDQAKARALKAEHDLTNDELNFCYHQMKDHARAKDRKLACWDAGFASWVRKSVRDGEIGPGSRSRRTGACAADRFADI